MREKLCLAVTVVLVLGAGSLGWAKGKGSQFPQNPTFFTRALTPFAIEGLTGDATGNLYTTGRQPDTTKKCPVWRIDSQGNRVTVGFIANSPACNPSGIAFDAIGNLYIADAGVSGVWQVSPDPVGCASDDSSDPACGGIPDGILFATGVPGTNGLAFDRNGNLWTGDGTTGLGRVWKITTCATPPCPVTEVFRIQPMANTLGVGRQNSTLQPPPTAASPQNLVANGLAFNLKGELFIADTARGAIWKIQFNPQGNLRSPVNCDTTFTVNTLCLSNILIAHPLLEGADGFVLDRSGSFWVAANERNAVIVFARNGQIIEIFRNLPDPATGLRNAGPLEFPASPFINGKTFCTSNSDGNRRDNSPRSAGEVNGTGKISCMVDELKIPGLPLPVE
jgi:sugar lactone lactonase YvrE